MDLNKALGLCRLAENSQDYNFAAYVCWLINENKDGKIGEAFLFKSDKKVMMALECIDKDNIEGYYTKYFTICDVDKRPKVWAEFIDRYIEHNNKLDKDEIVILLLNTPRYLWQKYEGHFEYLNVEASEDLEDWVVADKSDDTYIKATGYYWHGLKIMDYSDDPNDWREGPNGTYLKICK